MFVLKLIVVYQLHDHPLLQPDSGLDTTAYVTLADRVRAGDWLLGPDVYFVSPLYIYFLAVVLAVFDSFTAVRVVQAALGTAAVLFVYVGARAWFGARAAWFAAVAAALAGIFSFYEALLLQAALDPFLTAAMLAALAVALNVTMEGNHRARTDHFSLWAQWPPWLRSSDVPWFVLAGVAFGVASLNRPNVLLPAIVVLVLLAAIRRVRGALLVAAGLAAALAPVVVRNAVVSGTWSPVSSHGGLNFYIGNSPDADGTYHSVPGITPDISGQSADAVRVASIALGRPVGADEASSYFLDRGLAWIRANPAPAARLFARKMWYTFAAAHIPLNDSYAFYAYDQRTILVLLFVGAWLLVPLGAAGLVAEAPRERFGPYLVWASFVPAYAVAVAIFFVSDRYRVPLLVPLAIGTGAALDTLLRQPSRRVALVAACGLLAIGVNSPTGLDDGRVEERTRMGEQAAAAGRVPDADAWAARAEAGNGQAALVELRVGRALDAHGESAAAVRHLERANRLEPGRGETAYALGQALLDAGRAREAVAPLRTAVEKGVRPDLAGFDLARALAASGDRRGAADALARVTPSNPGDAASWIALGDLAIRLDAGDLERRFFGRAVAIDPSNATSQLNLAVALAQSGEVEAAREHARRAIDLKPDYVKARQLLDALK